MNATLKSRTVCSNVFLVILFLLIQGWIECVGIADRACYDLSVHTKASGDKLVAQVDLPEPVSFTCEDSIPYPVRRVNNIGI